MSPDATALLLDTVRLQHPCDAEGLAAAWHSANPIGLSDLLDYEGASLWLYRRLAELGILNVPEATFAAELTKRARQITAYNLLVDVQRDAVIRSLGTTHIPHLLLKGCALRLMASRVPYADARLTADVDVLVPQDSLEPAWDRLREAGFTVATADEDRFDEHHHLPPLRDELGVRVDLHRSTSTTTRPIDAWARMSAGAAQLARAGTVTMVPPPTELLWHAIAHAARHGARHGHYGFLLRSFLDAAAIIGAEPNLDWDTIRERLSIDELENPVTGLQWLGAAHWLAGSPGVPDWLRASPKFDLHTGLSWRGAITRSLARHRQRRGPDGEVPQAFVRLSRLLMEEGIRTELKLSPTLPTYGRTAAARAGRRIAARGARLVYLAWRRLNR
jgi:hypothetical protein